MFYTLNTQIYSFYRGSLLENIPKAIIFIPKNNFLYLYPCFSIHYILKIRYLFLKENFIPDKRESKVVHHQPNVDNIPPHRLRVSPAKRP